METIGRVKAINIKDFIEEETGSAFTKNNFLEECPFCGSGKGNNHSPAFSINEKDNYFKCFSCGSQGSAIDFMILKNDGWKEHQSINYLKEKYLNIIPVLQANHKQLSAFEKTIFAIKNNSIYKASDYLTSRGIDIKQLPKQSYWYDALLDAIVFVDAKNQLINRRMINQKQGEPKARNQGTLNESIYDNLFKPESDTVFIHEGIINALSMPEQSSIALFSTENKVKTGYYARIWRVSM